MIKQIYFKKISFLHAQNTNKIFLNSTRLTSTSKLSHFTAFILFQIDFVAYLAAHKSQLIVMNALHQSLLCVFNLLVDQHLLDALCHQANYSTLVSHLINAFYQLIWVYFFQPADANLVHTPTLSSMNSIDYTGHQFTNDILFGTATFDTLLKLRFVLTNYRSNSSSNVNGESSDSGDSLSSMKSTYCANTLTHRFLQHQSHFFRRQLPLHMLDLVEKIYLSLCRLPVLERFIRIPDSLWRMTGFKLAYSQFLKSDSSALPPLEYLRDPQVLKEHLKHILSVGWTTRTQFEYEYVNMLTFLHNLSDDYYLTQSSPTTKSSNLRVFFDTFKTLFTSMPKIILR